MSTNAHTKTPRREPASPVAGPHVQLGPVSVHEVYPLSIFAALSGLGRAGLRQARRAGLRIAKVGRRRFVSGKDWADFLASRSGDNSS